MRIRPIAERLDYSTKLGAKTIYPHSWYRFYINPKLSYLRPKRIFKDLDYAERLDAGIEIQYNNNIGIQDVFEIKFNQGYTLKIPNLPHFNTKHSVELNQRFQFITDDWQSSFGLQLTYEASMNFKFNRLLDQNKQGFFFPLRFKLYWNLIEAGFFNDVVKIRPGIGYHINQEWNVLFLVGYNYVKDITADVFQVNNIIFQIQVVQSLHD